MKSTFKTSAQSMIVVEPSPTRGAVWITDIRADGSRHIVAVPLHLAAVLAQAVEACATIIEESCSMSAPAPERKPWPNGGELSPAERELAGSFALAIDAGALRAIES